MVRHIILWQFSDEVREAGRQEETLELLRGSALSMSGRIDGLVCVDLSKNIAGGEYDFVFCADFISQEALDSYQTHPLHEAHKARSAPYVKHRLVADYIW